MTYHPKNLALHAETLWIFSVLLCLLSSPAYAGDDWQPILPEELKMTAEPKAPGAPAIYLYRQVDRDDATGHIATYERIKILTEEGRKYANVEIAYFKNRDNIKGIKARTIEPDGTIVDLQAKPFDKTIVKVKGLKYEAKTFTMPDVRVGSIIEYRYTDEVESFFIYDSYWTLSADLFTKFARFSLTQGALPLRWSWPNGLPEGTQPPREDHHTIRLETQNVPAFQAEDFMPPERAMQFRVDFVYSRNLEADETKYWKQYGESRFRYNEEFLNKHKVLEQAVTTIVQPTDDAQTKLKKIYARVQQMRNFDHERRKTAQEEKREKRRDIHAVDDVWKEGGGTGSELNYLFVGLARAAGMQAFFVDVSTRKWYFFNPKMMNSSQLNDNVVLVRLEGKDVFLDPGTWHMPFALLPWYETAVKSLQCDKDGGPWIETPMPGSDVSKIERTAHLHISEGGVLEGDLTVTFSGLEAVEIRHDGEGQDDAARKKILEDAIHDILSADAEVNLVNKPDWDSSSPTLQAEFTIKVRGWLSNAGRRQFLPMGLFGGGEKHVFEHANRIHPVYFHYVFSKWDDLTIALPQGWKTGSLPAPIQLDQKEIAYHSKAEDMHGAVHLSRLVRLDILTVDAKHYEGLRNFFQYVRSGDERQIVLESAAEQEIAK